MMVAPLALVNRDGPQSIRTGMPAIFERLEREHDPEWIAEAAKRPESKEFERLAAAPDAAAAARALALYRSDKLATPGDYRSERLQIRDSHRLRPGAIRRLARPITIQQL